MLMKAKAGNVIKNTTEGIDWQAWIGINDKNKEGVWTTVKNQQFNTIFHENLWINKKEEPHDPNHVRNRGALDHDGTYADVSCNFKLSFYCEWDR